MRLTRCIARIGFLLAACLAVPSARAAWGSIHGNNRGGAIPARPSFGPSVHSGGERRGFAGRAPEVRHEGAPHFEGGGRGFERAPERGDWGRYRAWEGDRYRGDFDDDWGHSYFWSGYHPGLFFNVLPPGYFSFSFGGTPYYYDQGVYYQPQANGYVVVAPPIGAVVPALPPGAESIFAGNSVFYYANGTFYTPAPNGYQVVAPPLGVTVSTLPPDATPVTIDGVTYYQSNGVYYMPVMQNGVTAYETVQPSQNVQPMVQPPQNIAPPQNVQPPQTVQPQPGQPPE